ncbi:MAG: hydroxyacid dehydrogenase [Mesorhizobium amorphae]|nr:MAG: hydroxyacid dehydrogenase [Mesorhizobium amorphae]
MSDAALLDRLVNALGPRGVLTDSADLAPFLSDWRGLFQGQALCVLRPDTTQGVADAVRLCGEAGVSLVPQGGNTSMVAGATPDATGRQIVLSLSRLNRIRAVDEIDMAIVLDAGVIVQRAQATAAEKGCTLPLSFSAEGSATIGGALSTNAGGNNTIRFGNARDLLLGLEVVLPDGRIWNGMRPLRKDNTGYALRHLFAGAEGTLGIVTGAVLKLVPQARSEEVMLCALPDAQAALSLYRRLRAYDESSLRAFEFISGTGMELALAHIEGVERPLAERAPAYALVDLASTRRNDTLRDIAEEVVGEALEAGEVLDAVIADSLAQRAALWRLREEQSEAQKRAGANVKNDVSVPVSRVPDLIRLGAEAVERLVPGTRAAPFGHLGDGNIHLNFVKPEGADDAGFLVRSGEIADAINAVVRGLDGSFSAEHGIGRIKTETLRKWREGPELDTMRAIKRAIDPQSLMNPGKLLP